MSKPRFILVVATIALAAAPAAQAADGAAIFKDNCAKCHGATGTADSPTAKALKVPSLQADANVKKMTAAEIAQRIKGNAKHPPAVTGLSEADLDAAAGYAKTLAQ